MEHLVEILQWLLPSGIGSVALWLSSKTARKVRTTKEVHDIYKEMYESTSNTLREIRKENERLYEEFRNLKRAVSCAFQCKYFDDCPVNVELQKRTEAGQLSAGRTIRAGGQRDGESRANNEGDTGTGIQGGTHAVI
jgi:hypothetical protein